MNDGETMNAEHHNLGVFQEQVGQSVIIRGLEKSYPGVKALDCLDLDIHTGEIHALLGQNGAGKSTFIKILSGAEQPDAGTVKRGNRFHKFRSPQDSQRAGIFTIFQELSLVPELSVAENIFISDLPKNSIGILNWKLLKKEAKKSMEWLGFDIEVDVPIRLLSVSQKQGVELAKALHHKAEVVLLDEPSAALPQPDVRRLFAILKNLKKAGIAIIYISHRLEEVQELCDVATVLRDGKKVGTYKVSETSSGDLIRAMVGRNVTSSLLGEALIGDKRPRLGTGGTGEVVMQVTNFNDGRMLNNISFELNKGEILGITGLLGNGQAELAACMFGTRQLQEGTLTINGRKVNLNTPRKVINAGMGFLPEDRKTQGLVLEMPIESNITMASHSDISNFSIINRKKEQQIVQKIMKSLEVKASGTKQLVGTLSGGNQQKIVLAKWLVSRCKILIFAEPTRGIDVGAKEEIYQLIKQFAEKGGAVVIITSEIPEAGMCDRVLVMSKGIFTGELKFEEIDPQNELILDLCCE
jgi:ribose transport system ATP-binding protein